MSAPLRSPGETAASRPAPWAGVAARTLLAGGIALALTGPRREPRDDPRGIAVTADARGSFETRAGGAVRIRVRNERAGGRSVHVQAVDLSSAWVGRGRVLDRERRPARYLPFAKVHRVSEDRSIRPGQETELTLRVQQATPGAGEGYVEVLLDGHRSVRAPIRFGG